MKINQSEIVLLPYPFSNLTGKKIRPALIISNNSFNEKSKDCIAIPLTTVIKDEPYSIMINQKNMAVGKLLRQSRIRADKIFSVQKDLIVMKVGKVDNEILMEIKKILSKIL